MQNFRIPRRDLQGFQAIIAAKNTLGNIKRNTQQGFRDGLEAAGKAIYNRSQRYVPVDTGLLKRSGRVESDQITPGLFRVIVIYGPAQAGFVKNQLTENAFYAVYVHEMQYARSGKLIFHQPPTQWKYLERAVQETSDRQAQLVAKFTGAAVRQRNPVYEVTVIGGPRFERVYGLELDEGGG